MANLPWLHEVQSRLVKNGLPPQYIRRFMEELSDHLQDIMEENMSTEAKVLCRLGDAKEVADMAVDTYRQRSYLGRHPWAAFLVFAVSPIVSMIVLEAVALCILAFAFQLIGEVETSHLTKKMGQVGQAIAPYFLTLFTVVIPSVGLCLLYCKLAGRFCLRKSWMIASCVSVSAMAMLLYWSVRFSDMPGKNALTLGLWIPLWCGWLPLLQSLTQFILPFGIGLWFMRRNGIDNPLQIAS